MWGNLVDSSGLLLHAGNECYIVGGSCSRGGTSSVGYQTTITSGRVTILSNCGKVVVVLPTGSSDVSRTRVTAVTTPDSNSLDSA